LLTRTIIADTHRYFLFKLLTDTAAGFGGEDALAVSLATVAGHPGYVDLLDNGYTTWPEAWGNCADKPDDLSSSNNSSRTLGQPAPVPGCATCFTCKQWDVGSASKVHGTLNGVGQQFISGIGGIRRPLGGVG
jgi:hypothetical protein